MSSEHKILSIGDISVVWYEEEGGFEITHGDDNVIFLTREELKKITNWAKNVNTQFLTAEEAEHHIKSGGQVFIRLKGTDLPWFRLDVWRGGSTEDMEYKKVE